MSSYEVARLCRELDRDRKLRDSLRSLDPSALRQFDLSTDERRAIICGDVRTLHDLGVHAVLLVRLARHGVAGLTDEMYAKRIQEA
jgi:hypothetical protein